jgi:hypothetical protein
VHKSTDLRHGSGVSATGFLNKEFRLLDRYELQGELVQALENTKYHKHLAEKVENCHKRFRHKRCDQNHDWAANAQDSCSVRLCPHCAFRRSQDLANSTRELMVGREGLRYLVLAERNSENLLAGIRSLYKAWTSLRRSVRWKRKVRGCIAVLEVTYNLSDRTWHPHLNVLMEGEYFPFEELNQAWIKATKGNGRTSYIEKADESTVYELMKYTLKVAEKDGEGRLHLIFDQPAALDEFLAAVYGARLVRAYGIFHGLKVDEEDVPEQVEKCPDCGSTSVVDLGSISHKQLSFDFEKQVFRVQHRAPDVVVKLLAAALNFNPEEFCLDRRRNPSDTAAAVEARARTTHYERAVTYKFSRQLAA